MTPFNPNATCPKCGGGEIGASHKPDIRERRKQYVAARIGLSAEEHIERTCTTCGYSWPEAPLDTKESA